MLVAAGFALLTAAPATAAASPPDVSAAPAIHVGSSLSTGPPVESANWSGYFAMSTVPFVAAEAEWVQPAVTCAKPLNWAVFWVGLDGWTDNTVEQAGTSALCRENSSEPPQYFTWWEMYPTNQIQVASVAVAPGNSVRAEVTFTPKTGKYTLTVLNKTTKKHFTITTTCGAGLECQRSTAEWIAERPTFSSGELASLADFGALKFAADKAGNTTKLTLTGKEVPVLKTATGFPLTPVDMVGTADETLASPSPFSRGAFTETWLAE